MKANFMRNSDSLFKLFSIVRIMPAVIITRHHGEIEGGYYGAFTQFVRFGDYTFTTQSFCRLVSRLAETPETQRESVRGYVDDRFQERYGDYMTSLFENMDDTDPISSIEDHIAETAGEAPIEDELDVFGESIEIPVGINKVSKEINLGVYFLSHEEFACFSHYVARGGFMGWQVKPPEHAARAMQAMESSENPLFISLKKLTK